MAQDSVNKLREDFKSHMVDDAENFKNVLTLLESIDKKLGPVSETYTTVTNLGKWAMALLVSISLIVGIAWGVVQIVISNKPT